MGNETSSPRQMERTLFNMKLTSKQLISESKKFESKAKAEARSWLEHRLELLAIPRPATLPVRRKRRWSLR